MYKKIEAKSALHKLKKKRLPYDWDLNIYRGCIHRCEYCYALYSHSYLDRDDCFFDDVFVKSNVAEILDRELSKKSWRGDIINIGGVTDSYQKAEEEFMIMRAVLEVMIKHENPIIISTKSDLILRDYDLLSRLAEKTYVNIATTITAADDKLQEKIEPGAISSKERFKILEEFANTKASTGLHVMPIMPYISDSKENIEEILSWTKNSPVSYLLTGTLNLVGKTKENFFKFVQKEYGEHYSKYLELYKNWLVKKEYNVELYKMIHELKKKYNINSNYTKPIQDRLGNRKQMKLF
jgi:DNA repair photolyase